jgi:hypothetical protein
MHVIITTIFILFFVICILWMFSRKNEPDRLFAPSASLPVDPPVVPVIVPPIPSAIAENESVYLKHTRKGCKSFVAFTTVTKAIIEADFMDAINACESENLTGSSGYRCVGTIYANDKWNSCTELDLRKNAGTWLNATHAKKISYIPKMKGTNGGNFLLRSDLGCKTKTPFSKEMVIGMTLASLNNKTSLQAAIDACDTFTTTTLAGACLGVVSEKTAADEVVWHRCREFQPDHDTLVWAKETAETALSY